MSESVAVAKVYEELKALRNDIREVKYALMPVEKISARERKELDRIFKQMKAGKEKSFSQIISKWGENVFDVRLGRDAEKFYDKADSKLKDRLKELFAVLAQNPVPVDAYDVKKISGPENEYRIRLSSYRVVYCVDWDDKVVRVGKIERKDDCTYD